MRHWKNRSAGWAMCTMMLIPTSVATTAEPEELGDLDITLAVQAELIQDVAVPAHNIDVDTTNGIVTLSGSVDTYYAKLQARDAAESVKGVLKVINDIDVKPIFRTDAQIRRDVISALAADPVTESYDVDVRVVNGVVTLIGEVDSYTEKLTAASVAEDVKGVTDVTNLLIHDVVEDRTDAEIESEIEDRLRSDASIAAGLISVRVAHGEVTLNGSVGSAREKSEAESEAWNVAGVSTVTNKLDVKWWLDGSSGDWRDGWDDEDMEQAVENALFTNPRVVSFNVTPSVDDGVATLIGTVNNLRAKQAAEEEALDVLGIWRVKNYLRVRPAPQQSDTDIANEIRKALRRDPYVDRYDITVSVNNGKAYLNGEVDSWYMRKRAGNASAGVRGVVEVQNNLVVNYEFTAKSDREIKEEIESQLFWSPFVDSDDVKVEVNSGVATLSGTVEDWDAFQAAKENAREGGATAVLATKLKITNGNGGD